MYAIFISHLLRNKICSKCIIESSTCNYKYHGCFMVPSDICYPPPGSQTTGSLKPEAEAGDSIVVGELREAGDAEEHKMNTLYPSHSLQPARLRCLRRNLSYFSSTAASTNAWAIFLNCAYVDRRIPCNCLPAPLGPPGCGWTQAIS